MRRRGNPSRTVGVKEEESAAYRWGIDARLGVLMERHLSS